MNQQDQTLGISALKKEAKKEIELLKIKSKEYTVLMQEIGVNNPLYEDLFEKRSRIIDDICAKSTGLSFL